MGPSGRHRGHTSTRYLRVSKYVARCHKILGTSRRTEQKSSWRIRDVRLWLVFNSDSSYEDLVISRNVADGFIHKRKLLILKQKYKSSDLNKS